MPQVTINFSDEQYRELNELKLDYAKEGISGLDMADIIKFILQRYGFICFSESLPVEETQR